MAMDITTSSRYLPIDISTNRQEAYESDEATRNWIHDLELIKFDQIDDDPPLINLPFDTKIGICATLAISFVVGSFFKSIMYSFVLVGENVQGWSQKPITTLILTSSIIHHITHGWLVIWYILALMNERSLTDLLHPNWCDITQYVGCYGIAYLSVGSLGIAIYRALYIRHENLVKYVVGERVLLIVIWSLSIFICGVITLLFNMERSSQRFQVNMCQGISGTHAQIMIDYQAVHDKKLVPTTSLQMIALAALLAIQTIEFAIYVWFFNYRYKNDNGNVSLLLTEDVIRSRNTKNVGTFVGQFYGFLMEYSFLILIFLLIFFADVKHNHTKAMLNMVKFVDFGLLSAVEVFSSPNLRAYMWRIIKGN